MLGLDRLPEVKTLRAKIAALGAGEGRAAQWQSCLAKEWIEAAADPADAASVGLFYVDGHARSGDCATLRNPDGHRNHFSTTNLRFIYRQVVSP